MPLPCHRSQTLASAARCDIFMITRKPLLHRDITQVHTRRHHLLLCKRLLLPTRHTPSAAIAALGASKSGATASISRRAPRRRRRHRVFVSDVYARLEHDDYHTGAYVDATSASQK